MNPPPPPARRRDHLLWRGRAGGPGGAPAVQNLWQVGPSRYCEAPPGGLGPGLSSICDGLDSPDSQPCQYRFRGMVAQATRSRTGTA